MNLLRRIPTDIRTGLRACRDLLLWGRVYPELSTALVAELTSGRPRTNHPATEED